MRALCLLLVLGLAAGMPPAARAEDAPAEETKNVSLVLHDVDVIDAIEKLATMAGKNVVVSPKVKGKVTLEFNDTPFLKALQQVAAACGCGVQVEGFGVYTVAPNEEARRRRNFIKRMNFEKVSSHVQRTYDVRDLLERNFVLPLIAPQGLGEEVSESIFRGDSLVVRASPAAQKKISECLAELRKHLVKGEPFDRITVSGNTIYIPRVKSRVVVQDGRVVAPGLWTMAGPLHREEKRAEALPALGESAAPPSERVYAGGRTLRGWKFKGVSGFQRGAEPASKAKVIRERAVQLSDAAVLLKAAGDEAGARRAFARAKKAYAAATAMDSTAALKGLHTEVRALRNEVRELTGLVRLLLQK